MEPKPASESVSQIVHWMGVGDANSAGNIHGGTVMKLVDEAAGLAAIKHSRQPGGHRRHGSDGVPGAHHGR